MSESIQTFLRLRSRATGDWLAPEELRGRLVEDAERNGVSLTEAIVQILARRYGVTVEPAARKTSPLRDSDVIVVWIPAELHRVIAFASHPKTVQQGILHTLAAHYGLRMPVRRKQVRRRRTPTA